MSQHTDLPSQGKESRRGVTIRAEGDCLVARRTSRNGRDPLNEAFVIEVTSLSNVATFMNWMNEFIHFQLLEDKIVPHEAPPKTTDAGKQKQIKQAEADGAQAAADIVSAEPKKRSSDKYKPPMPSSGKVRN